MSDTSPKPLPIIKSVVTYLEMTGDPKLTPINIENFTLRHVTHPDVKTYLEIYRAVGRDYIWNYRPGQSHQEIFEIIQSPSTQMFYLYRGKDIVGMAELDASVPDDIELVHFGLIPTLLGHGLGKQFLHNVLELVWRQNVNRIWLSTCGLDHPKAIGFYEHAGFVVFKQKTGEFKDYRFSDFYELSDAPHIPLAS